MSSSVSPLSQYIPARVSSSTELLWLTITGLRASPWKDRGGKTEDVTTAESLPEMVPAPAGTSRHPGALCATVSLELQPTASRFSSEHPSSISVPTEDVLRGVG